MITFFQNMILPGQSIGAHEEYGLDRNRRVYFLKYCQYHPFGEGHVQAHSVLRLEQGTEQGQLPQHATEDLQQNPEQSQHQEKSAEPCHDTWRHQASHADSDTHSMYTAPPVPRHPRLDSDTMQNSLNEKYMHTESAPWSA